MRPEGLIRQRGTKHLKSSNQFNIVRAELGEGGVQAETDKEWGRPEEPGPHGGLMRPVNESGRCSKGSEITVLKFSHLQKQHGAKDTWEHSRDTH